MANDMEKLEKKIKKGVTKHQALATEGMGKGKKTKKAKGRKVKKGKM